MREIEFDILLCTNGHETTHPALEYGVWLAKLLDRAVFLLGIDEDPKFHKGLTNFLDETASKLTMANINFECQVVAEHDLDAIVEASGSRNYLTVVGPLGRPVWQRMVQGRSFRRLLARIKSPILYVPDICLPLEHILVCTGGLGYALSLERLSLVIARAAGSRITLLHVIEPIDLDYPTAQEIQHHPDNILESDTPQAQNLKHALAEMQSAGVEATLKIRHGSVVHEILAEIHSGDYDLVGLGSPYSAKSLRHLYTPNVTAEVAEAIHVPVLSVRFEVD